MVIIGKRYLIQITEDCSSAAIYRAAMAAAGLSPETTVVANEKKLLVSQHIFDSNITYRMRRYKKFSMPRELWAMHGLRVGRELDPNEVEVLMGFFAEK